MKFPAWISRLLNQLGYLQVRVLDVNFADLWGWLLGVLQPDLEIISPMIQWQYVGLILVTLTFSRRLCCQGTSNVRGNWRCDRYNDEGWWGYTCRMKPCYAFARSLTTSGDTSTNLRFCHKNLLRDDWKTEKHAYIYIYMINDKPVKKHQQTGMAGL